MRTNAVFSRILLPFAALALAPFLRADPTVVFGKTDFYDLGATPAPDGPTDPGPKAFFDAYRSDRASHGDFETAMELISPPEWGKTISAATGGKMEIHPSFAGGLSCRLSLGGLLPNHDYILTLNGNPALPGNDLFLSAVPGNPKERYYDFLIVRSDAQGRYEASLGIYLKQGKYKARCYVKDTSDFKIVLYKDYFPFEVK